MIAVNFKSYVQTFIKNRACNEYNMTLEQYVVMHPKISQNRRLVRALQRKQLSKALHISVLLAIIRDGDFLKKNEAKSPGQGQNTVGDMIMHVKDIWENIVHAGTTNLDKIVYEKYLSEFFYIAGILKA